VKTEEMKLIKTSAVLIRRPCLTGKHGKIQFIPFIAFSGKIFNDYGFEVGKKFEIYGKKDQLVLKSEGFKYKNPIIKQEVKIKWK
jgi:hypothetical protein